MEKRLQSNKKTFQLEESNLKKINEIRSRKNLPPVERRDMRRSARENEWEQEYYIIYNSYILEENEPE